MKFKHNKIAGSSLTEHSFFEFLFLYN